MGSSSPLEIQGVRLPLLAQAFDERINGFAIAVELPRWTRCHVMLDRRRLRFREPPGAIGNGVPGMPARTGGQSRFETDRGSMDIDRTETDAVLLADLTRREPTSHTDKNFAFARGKVTDVDILLFPAHDVTTYP